MATLGFITQALDGEGNPIQQTLYGQASGGSMGIIQDNSNTSAELQAALTPQSKMLGQQLWNIKVTLNNHIQTYELAPHAIKQLELEDDILKWPMRGQIVIDNRVEGFERSRTGKYYHIRGDARDEIKIEIKPNMSSLELPEKIWNIAFEGVVYDVEDLPVENLTTKVKKLYFWDKRFQIMQETVVEWSTATGERRGWFKDSTLPPEPIAHATDIERSMYTGDAIASLLIKAGYEDYIDTENWDGGAGKINFTAKSGQTIQDCIDYIQSQHISNSELDNSVGLVWSRGEQKFQLLPRWKAYNLAGKSTNSPGELQLEHLFFQEYADTEQNTSSWKAPYLSTKSFEKDIKAVDYNTILTYRFSQTSGLDNSKAFVTRPVYSHWHKGKQFQIDVKENEIVQVKNYFKEHYVKYLLGSDYPVFVLNNTKKEEKSIDPRFSPVSVLDPTEDRIVRGAEGRGKTLFAGIFLNNTMSVRLQGSTHRLAGTFIGIDRLKADSDNNYDYQVCGQYYVVSVRHIIRHQKYLTDLVLVKIHAYEALQNNEGVT